MLRAGLLHHSDQRSTYASEDYQKVLDEHCYDNAAMESWNSTLKSELGERFLDPADAKAKLFDYIEVFYNQARMHSSGTRSRRPLEHEEADASPLTTTTTTV